MRSGKYVSNLSGAAKYYSFQPAPLPPDPPLALSDQDFILLGDVKKMLGELNCLSTMIPDINLFIFSFIRKEAVMSSQIEGTQATLEDIFDVNSWNDDPDLEELINFIAATNYALNQSELPLCSRLLCRIHEMMMKGVRGQEKSPGQFRTSQNWIGGRGGSLQKALFVPPNVEDMRLALSALDHYINAPCQYDNLIRAALIHYQFETIHPFLDGNGRVGRLLIILFLIFSGELSSPCLYLSAFLKANQGQYYQLLSSVRNTGDYETWVRFFLSLLHQAVSSAITKIKELSDLVTSGRDSIAKIKHSRTQVMKVFDFLARHPIITIKMVAKQLNISFNAASRAVKKLEGLKILVPATSNARNRRFVYANYLIILNAN